MEDITLKEKIAQSAATIDQRLQGRTPEVGIILGSGLGPLAEQIEDPIYVPFGEVPFMGTSSCTGHVGRFVCGTLGG